MHQHCKQLPKASHIGELQTGFAMPVSSNSSLQETCCLLGGDGQRQKAALLLRFAWAASVGHAGDYDAAAMHTI